MLDIKVGPLTKNWEFHEIKWVYRFTKVFTNTVEGLEFAQSLPLH
jgi:hypothetical protein